MKKNNMTLIIIVSLLLFSGCSKTVSESSQVVTYTFIDGKEQVVFDDYKTFTVEEDNPEYWLTESAQKRKYLSNRYYRNKLEEEQKEEWIGQRTKNWHRVYDGDIVNGYSEEYDGLYYKFTAIEDLDPDRIIE